MAELGTAMDTIGQVNLLGFDACLMGMTEIGYQLRDHSQVMVASEETIPYDGYPYDQFLDDLVADPSMSAATLGGYMVDAYGVYYGSSGECTLSSIDLSQMGNAGTGLAGSLENFANLMLTSATPADWTAVAGCPQWRKAGTIRLSVIWATS